MCSLKLTHSCALRLAHADSFVAMDKERLEAAEAERSIAEFSRKKESLVEYRQNLLKEIEQTRQSIQKKRERNPESLCRYS
jgi:hypothetical protein